MTFATPDAGAALTISQDPRIVTVIERFEVPDDRKDEAVEAAKGHVARTWMSDPAFVGAAVFRGREKAGLSCYSQWHRDGGNTAPFAPPASRSLAALLSAFRLQDSRTYSMDFTETKEGGAASTEISLERSPLAHYGLFAVRPEDQNRVMDLGRGNSIQSMGTPGLLSINWHRSLDGGMIVNLGRWTGFEGLAELEKQEGFGIGSGDVYWKGWADWSAELFDVAVVMARR